MSHKKFILTAIVLLSVFQLGFFNLGGGTKMRDLNLKNVQRISRSCYLIQHEYYDKARLQPRKMLEEGFFELAKEVPEVLPKFTENTLYFQLGTQLKQVDLSYVKQFYDILYPVSEAFDFLQENYKGAKKFEDMEYAFIGGMLAVLDPHSNILPPKVYEEFKTQTSGHYGGLGIVIGLKENELTVISPIEDTPAFRAGVLADDKILQIDDQSTVNMALNDAVDLMRGEPNTKVVLKIKSKNRDERLVTLIREVIQIVSVQSKLLKVEDKKIGVLRVKGFQEDTYTNLLKNLDRLSRESTGHLDGLVLDLRNNPGGLLDQAILMSDKFLEQGDVVFTVGAGDEMEDVAVAKAQSTDVILPMIVLINEGSASASEIVAGALRNNNRAVVMGNKSFGKGSVQSLFSLQDGSSLKLTVAQYLTPGKQSIQAVGIVPDIHVSPSVVSDEFFDLKEDTLFSERKLDSHLENQKYVAQSTSAYETTHLKKDTPHEMESEYTSKIREGDDYLLSLATKVLARGGDISKEVMLKNSAAILSEERQKQDQEISVALAQKKVDWSLGQTDKTVNVSSRYEFLNAEGQVLRELPAGQEVRLRVTLKNNGAGTLHRVLGEMDSFNPLIKNKELVFGKIASGEERQAEFKFKIPSEIINFHEDAKLMIYTEKTPDRPVEKRIATIFHEMQPPRLAYSYTLVDGGTEDTLGNKNGVPEKGEKIRMDVVVKNFGPGESRNTTVNLRNKEGSFVFLRKARENLGVVKAGAEGKASLLFDVKDGFDKPRFEMDFFVLDNNTKSIVSDTLKFTLVSEKGSVQVDPPFGELQILPEITVSRDDLNTSGKLLMETSVMDDKALRDLAIFVNGKKYYYFSLIGDAAQKEKKVSLELPLDDGLNSIVVQARGDRDMISQKNMSVVYNKPAGGALVPLVKK